MVLRYGIICGIIYHIRHLTLLPCRATTMDAKTLGNEVPAAANTIPTRNGSKCTIFPSKSMQDVITNANTAK
jgi:hypothetical protein